MRTKRIERLLKLLQALQEGVPVTVEELARLIDVSRRTVFRDLSLLGEAGIRFNYDRETRRYTAERPALLPPVSLTHAEALSLMMASRYMLDRPFVTDRALGARAALKLESMLPTVLLEFCGRMLKGLEIRPEQASDPTSIAATLTVLQAALAKRSKLAVRYDSYYEGDVIEATLHPYRLAYIHRGWYLIARSEQAGKLLTFKVERILQLKILDESYHIESSFSLDDYFGNAWLMIRGDVSHHVEIHFSKKVAGNVDEIAWHKTQQTRFEDDGSLLFEVDVDGIDEIAWWILGYGDQAQVLEPPELRERILEHARRMVACYAANEHARSG